MDNNRFIEWNACKGVFYCDLYRNTWQKDYIIIPECVNSHWIGFLLDVKESKIYICDSMGNKHNTIATQIIRYVYVARQLMNKKANDYTKWKMLYFSDLEGFKRQNDTHSCGPFLCTMLKCLLFKMQFSFHPKLARYTIANEIMKQTIFQ